MLGNGVVGLSGLGLETRANRVEKVVRFLPPPFLVQGPDVCRSLRPYLNHPLPFPNIVTRGWMPWSDST